MASQHGFQTNSTIQSAFWRYIPDPAIIPPGKIVFVELNNLQYINATADHNKVWLYYAASNVSTSLEPYILEGDAAQAFLSDFGGLFA